MENMSPTGGQYREIAELTGPFDYYSNSIYTYYTNFLDVIAYKSPEGMDNPRCDRCGGSVRRLADDVVLIELKREEPDGNLGTISQIQNYMRWARAILNPIASIRGLIVARDFSAEYKAYVGSHPEENISLIRYELDNGTLHLRPVAME